LLSVDTRVGTRATQEARLLLVLT